MKVFKLLFAVLLPFILLAQNDDAIVAPKLVKNSKDLYRSTVLSFYPGFWAPGVKLEWATTNKIVSSGFHTRGYLFLFNGVKMEPFIRVYFKKNAPEGAFAQFKLSVGIYDKNSFLFRGLYCYTGSTGILICPGDPGYVKQNDLTLMAGGGVAFGYQFLLGENKRFALDLFGGIQAIVPSSRIRNDDDIALWFMRGFPLELGIRLGKAF